MGSWSIYPQTPSTTGENCPGTPDSTQFGGAPGGSTASSDDAGKSPQAEKREAGIRVGRCQHSGSLSYM